MRSAIWLSALALGSAALAATPAAAPAGNPVTGQRLYAARCGGCHSLDANRIGPAHRGVVGRRVASAAGFAYSPALKRLGGIWTPQRLDLWLQGPQKLAPGSAMYLSVPDPGQRRDIIAWLDQNGRSGKTPIR